MRSERTRDRRWVASIWFGKLTCVMLPQFPHPGRPRVPLLGENVTD
jgi:hypothetical protein